MKKKPLILISVLLLTGTGYFFSMKGDTSSLGKKKLNVFIISVCSLKWSFLDPYSDRKGVTPRLNQFSQNSFVFENAFSDVSWSNVSGFLSAISPQFYELNDYRALGRPWSEDEFVHQRLAEGTPTYYFRSPEVHDGNIPKFAFFTDRKELRNSILQRSNWPFIVEYHLKLMHLPYYQANAEEKKQGFPLAYMPQFLRAEDIQYVETRLREFVEHPEKYPERMILNLILGDKDSISADLLRRLPVGFDPEIIETLSQKSRPIFVGLINNPILLDLWRKSPNYEKEVELIKRFYLARLSVFDRFLMPILNGFGDREFRENTVFIFMGDHGEAFGEHGYMAHSENTYDEVLQFPLFIRFPGVTQQVRIKRQLHQGTVAAIAKGIMEGTLTADNFLQFIENNHSDEYIFSRNCAGNEFAIRYKNEWKLIMNQATNVNQLFHLTTDPLEKKNVFDQYPEQAAELEEYWIMNVSNWRRNGMLHNCSPVNF